MNTVQPDQASPSDDRRPFARGTPEVAQLRKATSYLAATSRNRYDIAASSLLGVLINIAMLWGAVSLVAGLAAWQALNVHEVDTSSYVWGWPHGRLVAAVWSSPPAFGFLVFAFTRYSYRPPTWVARSGEAPLVRPRRS